MQASKDIIQLDSKVSCHNVPVGSLSPATKVTTLLTQVVSSVSREIRQYSAGLSDISFYIFLHCWLNGFSISFDQ